MLLSDLADTLTCAVCIDVTPTMFFMNHFTHSAPVKIRAPELTTCSIKFLDNRSTTVKSYLTWNSSYRMGKGKNVAL